MQKIIRLSDIKKIFSSKKLKKVKNDNWIYDYELKMAFKSEKYRQEFWNAINRAQQDIKEGRVTTWEEFEKEIDEWMLKLEGV